ncbi:FAD-dependent oxidoreductase [Thermosipho melanesiensis]|uniref:FAD dependent oxidoreductase n=2 Tax=Thermosipho melanesiensis TaxID=46541 RepID=A6LJP4_THEM4|nr:FAD-binding oxidoreductase [Thermosipho melanesiensis]ABR30145.1 FAD dependent oxidoreductase [Thermosipho melanesiensis BI429]OOC38157.1 FAD-dependent oxidoreductase [Thermosipho melanesiensis]OOC40078.1 FAD-dependent oxidoreductase [Thermosipho melanesiensis]OOC40131.1 FAD-dependent oxidoreductase [Thermosipho melanesiensis]OOC44074.1 FAD-dependent oxidoreductase [Thermosipho melanesiensis]
MYKIGIVGGGIIGCAIAYFLGKLGESSIILFEKSYLSSGATGRCGGGIRQQWSSRENVRLAKRSVKFFERFEEELGVDIEYRQGGYLLLAFNEKEVEQFERNVQMQRNEGLNVEVLTKREVKKRYPFINTNGLKMATFCQKDGHANPHKATFAFANAAKDFGIKIYTREEVLDIQKERGNYRIITNKGEYICEVLVNAAGPWSKEIGKMMGVELPTESFRHQIFVTEPVEYFFPFMAISFSKNFYMRQTLHGNFIMGQGDKDEKPGINRNVTFRFEKEMAKKMVFFFPFLNELRVLRHWSGEYNMSPDAQPILGAKGNFFYAVGFSGHGFMLAPAVGEAIAELILFGKTLHSDISHLNLDRFKGKLEIERNVV